MMTPWFNAGMAPARDGLYIIRFSVGHVSECWNMARWSRVACRWFAAGSIEDHERHEIGGGGPNVGIYQWRGLLKN